MDQQGKGLIELIRPRGGTGHLGWGRYCWEGRVGGGGWGGWVGGQLGNGDAEDV